jgi:protein-arginine kinase activator protein McsA
MWVKSAKAGFQKLYDVFEEKIYPKEKQEEKPVHFILTYSCDRCMTSEKHEAYMKKKEFQEERICPFCGEKLHMREFEIMNRW